MNGLLSTRTGWVDRIAEEYGRGRPLAMLFDYDGTLTPIVRHPSLARLTSDTRQRLQELVDLPEVKVGVISGRALSDVKTLVGLEGVYYAGSGGLELDLLGTDERFPDTDAIGKLIDGIQDQLVDLMRKFPGTWIEKKPGAISIHFRGLLPLAATCFRFEAAALLSMLEELRFRVVSEAIEVTPADGWDKGTAVESILTHMENSLGSPPLAVYFGDAANDADGMVIVGHKGGMSIGIGPDAPEVAEEQLADPLELGANLDKLTTRLKTRWEISPKTAEKSLRVENELTVNNSISSSAAAEVDAGLLLLDPDGVSRKKLANELEKLGWRVWQSETPEEATQLLIRDGNKIHVAMVDLQLPGLQGARTLMEFGQSHPHLIRCFMSADVSPYTAAAFARLSSLPLFVKPLFADDLNPLFRTLLKQENPKRSLAEADSSPASEVNYDSLPKHLSIRKRAPGDRLPGVGSRSGGSSTRQVDNR